MGLLQLNPSLRKHSPLPCYFHGWEIDDWKNSFEAAKCKRERKHAKKPKVRKRISIRTMPSSGDVDGIDEGVYCWLQTGGKLVAGDGTCGQHAKTRPGYRTHGPGTDNGKMIQIRYREHPKSNTPFLEHFGCGPAILP